MMRLFTSKADPKKETMATTATATATPKKILVQQKLSIFHQPSKPQQKPKAVELSDSESPPRVTSKLSSKWTDHFQDVQKGTVPQNKLREAKEVTTKEDNHKEDNHMQQLNFASARKAIKNGSGSHSHSHSHSHR